MIGRNFLGTLYCAWQYFTDAVRLIVVALLGVPNCRVCGKYSPHFPICKECDEQHFGVFLNEIKRKCTVSINEIYSLYPYQLWNPHIFTDWKLRGELIFTKFYAQKLYALILLIKAKYPSINFVIVPPREGKILQQGFDQMDELRKLLHNKYNIDFLNLLSRQTSTEQKSLNVKGRLATIGKSYTLQDEYTLVPSQICIIDDLITTGATIESCAMELRRAGAQTIIAISIYHTMGSDIGSPCDDTI